MYLLDYGWKDGFAEQMRRNFAKMAGEASRHGAVVIKGTVGDHFADEVLSWHHVNGRDAKNLLPAILVTTRHPSSFRERGQGWGSSEKRNRLLLVPLRGTCNVPDDVVSLVEQIFDDIRQGKALSQFEISRQMEAGREGAVVDAICLKARRRNIGTGVEISQLVSFLGNFDAVESEQSLPGQMTSAGKDAPKTRVSPSTSVHQSSVKSSVCETYDSEMRARDLRALDKFWRELPVDEVDYFFEKASGGAIPCDILYYYECAIGVLKSSGFYVCDEESRKALEDFAKPFCKSLSEVNYFVGSPDGRWLRLAQRRKCSNQRLWQEASDRFFSNVDAAKLGYRRLIDVMRLKWSEIDLNETSEAARKKRQQYDQTVSVESSAEEQVEAPAVPTKEPENQNISVLSPAPPADVLLVVVNDIERNAVLGEAEAILGGTQSINIVHGRYRTYHDLGTIGGARTLLVQSEMGTGTVGGSIPTVFTAIEDVRPRVVIMVGIAFGIDPKKQPIGQVIVSKEIQRYDVQRVGTTPEGDVSILPRGSRVPATPVIVSRFHVASSKKRTPKVKFGLLLSGESLVDNLDYRDSLKKMHPEAMGGEMEGSGLYVAAAEKSLFWCVVKAVCDHADGNKALDKDRRQKRAAKNAAKFVIGTIAAGGFV